MSQPSIQIKTKSAVPLGDVDAEGKGQCSTGKRGGGPTTQAGRAQSALHAKKDHFAEAKQLYI